MLYVEPLGGLGNRMRTIASYYMAARGAKQKMTVVWQRDAGMNCAAERLFSLPDDLEVIESPYITKPKMRARSAFRKMTHFACGRFFRRVYENWEAKKALTTETFPALAGSGDLYISSCYSLEADYERCDFSIFTPAQDIKRLADAVMDPLTGNCVGIHIRRTDNDKSIESSRTEDFVIRMQKEIDADDSVRFFLATDSPEEEASLRARFPGRIFTYEKRSLDRDLEQGILDAYVDLLCLAQTRQIYGSFYSSFSRCASAFNKIPLEIVSKDNSFNSKVL